MQSVTGLVIFLVTSTIISVNASGRYKDMNLKLDLVSSSSSSPSSDANTSSSDDYLEDWRRRIRLRRGDAAAGDDPRSPSGSRSPIKSGDSGLINPSKSPLNSFRFRPIPPTNSPSSTPRNSSPKLQKSHKQTLDSLNRIFHYENVSDDEQQRPRQTRPMSPTRAREILQRELHRSRSDPQFHRWSHLKDVKVEDTRSKSPKLLPKSLLKK